MDAATPPFISRLSFALYNALAGYYFVRAVTPPIPIRPPAKQNRVNPNAKHERKTPASSSTDGHDASSPTDVASADEPADRISSPLMWATLLVFRTLLRVLPLYTGLIALFPPPDSPVTPNPPRGHPLNRTLLTWNPTSAGVLTALTLACYVRTRAFGALGPDFTFELRRPSRLVTSGLYRYVRHPSYTAAALMGALIAQWYLRVDGALGAVVPVWVREVEGWVHLGTRITVAITTLILPVRVQDEEAMMKESFGSEWDDYCKRTWKMVPFLW